MELHAQDRIDDDDIHMIDAIVGGAGQVGAIVRNVRAGAGAIVATPG